MLPYVFHSSAMTSFDNWYATITLSVYVCLSVCCTDGYTINWYCMVQLLSILHTCYQLLMHPENVARHNIDEWCMFVMLSIYIYMYYMWSVYYAFDECYNAILSYMGPTFHSLPTLCDSPNALHDRFKAYHVFDLELIYVCMAMRFYRFHQYMLLLASMLHLLLM